jgi:Zn ribbon nucleic-acid-binding protein
MQMPGTFERTDPSLIPIDRPRCPKCQKRMVKIHYEDIKRFNCVNCGHFEISLASAPHPMKEQSFDLLDDAAAFIFAGTSAKNLETGVAVVKDCGGMATDNIDFKLKY